MSVVLDCTYYHPRSYFPATRNKTDYIQLRLRFDGGIKNITSKGSVG